MKKLLIMILMLTLALPALAQPEIHYTAPYEYGMAVANNMDGTYYIVDEAGNVIFTPGKVESVHISGENTIVVLPSWNANAEFYVREGGEFVKVPAVNSDFDLSEYYPNEGKLVVALDEPAILAHVAAPSQPLPRVDGATALFPMYSALSQAVFPNWLRFEYVSQNPHPQITCTRTNEAYRRLISGDADVIFVAGPSDAQIAAAAEQGVEFMLTPIAKEAFVFIVSEENPVSEITLEQIRGIYSGNITHWRELGAEQLGEIIAYQRPADSGSQTALERLMEGYELMPAPQDYVAWDMGTILDVVEYQNFPNAIGYSFRFFVTDLMDNEVKLLVVDGIAPTVENITSGAYPLTTQIYAVTRKGDFNINTWSFLAWVQSEQGMELIEKSGYVPEY